MITTTLPKKKKKKSSPIIPFLKKYKERQKGSAGLKYLNLFCYPLQDNLHIYIQLAKLPKVQLLNHLISLLILSCNTLL